MLKPQDRDAARLVLIFGFAASAALALLNGPATAGGLSLSSAEMLAFALGALVLLFVLARHAAPRGDAAPHRVDEQVRQLVAILDAQGHGIGSVGPDGIVRHASGFAHQGTPHRHFEGRPILACFQRDYSRFVAPMVARALAGETVRFTAEVNVTGVGPRVHAITYTPLRTPEGRPDGFVYEIIDLTDTHAAEARTRIAHAQLQDAIESMSDAFTLYDADQRLVAFNRAFRGLFRQGGETVRVGMTFAEVVELSLRNDLSRADVEADVWRRTRVEAFLRANGKPDDYQLRSGAWRRVLESRTRSGGFVGIYADISEIRRTEEKARESEARLQAILDNAPFGIFLKDVEGRFVVMNREMTRIGPVQDRRAIGRTVRDILGTFAAEEAMDRDSRVLRDRTVESAELQLPVDGHSRTLQITKFPVATRDGALLGIGCIATDVTQRRHLETQILQLQKMEAIGQLTGGVAHDFNNLLSVVLGNLSLLRRRLGPGVVAHRRLIDAAILASRRGASLTRQLLAFSRRQMLAPEAFRPGQAALDMQDLLRQSLGEHMEFSLDVADDHGPVFLDRAQFENALLNLVINARDAMPDRGRLVLTIDDHVLASGDPAAAQLPAGDYVRVRVRDNGHGMAPEIAARIFEPFFTTKGGDKGTGLGLSTAYGFARQSGGWIGVETAPGMGTTVTLLFPRHVGAVPDAPLADPARDVAAPADVTRAARRILVVEDEDLLRETAVDLLRGLGHDVVSAANGPAALEELARSGPFDLLFTDLVMPGGMTGIELASEARRRHPRLRVLATSGYASINVLRGDARDLPVLLSKPYSESSLAAHIAQVFAEEHD